MLFVKKTVREQINKEVSNAQLRWEKEKLAEINEYRKVWAAAKSVEIKELKKQHEADLQEKNNVISLLRRQIKDQKKAYKKFKELAIQNEILSTEIATESEAFLQLASRVVSSFSLLQFRAESINKKIEKKENKEPLLHELRAEPVDVAPASSGLSTNNKLTHIDGKYSY